MRNNGFLTKVAAPQATATRDSTKLVTGTSDFP